MYVHSSLIFQSIKSKLPTFFNIDVNGCKLNQNGNDCVCVRFKRTLKYFMKGFFYINQAQKELNLAHQIEQLIFKNSLSGCSFCNNVIFGSIKTMNMNISKKHPENLSLPNKTFRQIKIGLSLQYFDNITLSLNKVQMHGKNL